MPTVHLGLPARREAAPPPAATPGPNPTLRRAPKATIVGYSGAVTVTATRADAEMEVSGLAADWVEVPRPGTRPALVKAGLRLTRTSWGFELDGRGLAGDGMAEDAPVDAELVRLVAMARYNDQVTIGYSALEANRYLVDSGQWIITDLRFKVLRRRALDNRPTRIRVDLELTEAVLLKEARPGTTAATSAPAPTATAAAAPVATSSTAARVRRVTYDGATSLWEVAQVNYGDGNAWRAIAEANGIVDPRRIPAGTVLVLP